MMTKRVLPQKRTFKTSKQFNLVVGDSVIKKYPFDTSQKKRKA